MEPGPASPGGNTTIITHGGGKVHDLFGDIAGGILPSASPLASGYFIAA
jgi:hypothetical protein